MRSLRRGAIKCRGCVMKHRVAWLVVIFLLLPGWGTFLESANAEGLHNRARDYNRQLRTYHLANGYVVDSFFADASLSEVVAYNRIKDSALWTGTFLAAEALRAMVTGSQDAQRSLERQVEAVHRLFQVTGAPGYLARFTAPLGSGDDRLDAIYDPYNPEIHRVNFQGQDSFWWGTTSRDAYQGPIMGYPLAYQALSSEAHKQMIREDLSTLALELIKVRTAQPIKVAFVLAGREFSFDLSVDLQYVVLIPEEFSDGKPYIRIGSDSSFLEVEESSIVGFREFFPDFATLIEQIPLIGDLLSAPLQRPSSTMMLGAILKSAILVTDGVPGYQAVHDMLDAHYQAHIYEWLPIMNSYVYTNGAPPRCWDGYNGINISFMPLYTLCRLERDPARQQFLQQEVLARTMWPAVSEHKNVFFSYIRASQAPPDPEAAAIADAASTQLAGFRRPPFRREYRDNSSTYLEDPACPGNSLVAIDVKDRIPADFIWQKSPFKLVTKIPSSRYVYPGVDYLVAYWMGRYHGFLEDDSAGISIIPSLVPLLLK